MSIERALSLSISERSLARGLFSSHARFAWQRCGSGLLESFGRKVCPQTCHQRCLVHKIANILTRCINPILT
jgi:hypothetical protein